MNERTLTDDEMAERYGKGRWFVQTECRAGRWPHLRVGRSFRFTEEQVASIDALLEVKPKAKPVADAPVVSVKAWGVKGRGV